MRLFVQLLLLAVCCPTLFAQGLTSEGREFYLGHVNASHTAVITTLASGQYRVYAIVSSYTDNDVSVSYFNPQSGIETQPVRYSVDAYRSVLIPLDVVTMRMTLPGDIGEFRSCHITARDPVSVQYYSTGACAGGGYLALPVDTWGKNYVVATDADNPGYGAMVHPPFVQTADISNGCFLIIGALNGTTVTISPNARTGGGHPGATQGAGATGTPQPYTIALNRGQCYMVKSISADNNNDDDISGSIVKADKPIAVITAHEDANVGDGIVHENHETDARDFMIEQAIPWEYAASSGNYSVPMADSKGALDGGYGEDVRVFVADNNQATSAFIGSCGTTPTSYNLAPYSIPPLTKPNTTVPLEISCDTAKRLQVMQYELRSDGESSPWTTPSMMNIIPAKCWRNSYMWFVPLKQGLITTDYQEYFVTIISKGAVGLSVNGAGPLNQQPIESVLKNVAKKWTCIPGGQNYIATTYKFSPNTTYYAHSSQPFMAYIFGYTSTEITPPGPDPITEYGGFAFPGGMRGKAGGTANIEIKADEDCAEWNICATDKNNNGSIRSVKLIKDPFGNYLSQVDLQTFKTYESRNCRFELGTASYSDEVLQLVDESRLCAKLVVVDPTKDAYAAVAATDVNGNFKIVELSYYSAIRQAGDSLTDLGAIQVGDTISTVITKRFRSEMVVRSATMRSGKQFGVKAVAALPDSLVLNEPADFSVFFVSKDTGLFIDTLIISDGCRTAKHTVKARSITGLVYATDKNFGTIAAGKQRSDSIRVENQGLHPFSVNAASITGSADFIFNGSASLPITLMPGETRSFEVRYEPISEGADTALIQWVTDIREPYTNSIKTTSLLLGKAIQQSVRSGIESGFTVHPNPTTGKCTLDLRSLSGKATIVVYDLLGAECYRMAADAGVPVEMQLPALASGQYRMRVDINYESYDIPIIIGSLR